MKNPIVFAWLWLCSRAVWLLDCLMQALAWRLSGRSRIDGAGAFWDHDGPRIWSAWHEPGTRGGSWTLRLARLELVVDVRAEGVPSLYQRTPGRSVFSMGRADLLSACWNIPVARLALVLDVIAQGTAWVVGRIVASRRGYSAGVFFWHDQPSRWATWSEPGALNLRLGRLELNVDMPR